MVQRIREFLADHGSDNQCDGDAAAPPPQVMVVTAPVGKFFPEAQEEQKGVDQ
jgi:hypothetical protein